MLFQAQIASASCDGKPAINLTDGNDPAQMQLSGKGSAVANLGMDVQIVFVLRPPEPVTGRIANRAVQRQGFAFIHTRRADRGQPAGGQEARREALEKAVPLSS